jgi:hypothetical protein
MHGELQGAPVIREADDREGKKKGRERKMRSTREPLSFLKSLKI